MGGARLGRSRGAADELRRLRAQLRRLDQRSLLGYAVKQFYDNGGADAYVLRIRRHANAVPADLRRSATSTITASSPGEWADDYACASRSAPTTTTRFRLDVLHIPSNEAVVESFENLSMTEGDARFVETVINGRSAFIVVEATSATTPRPTPAGRPRRHHDAGDDGTVFGPADAAFRTALLAHFGLGRSPTASISSTSSACPV